MSTSKPRNFYLNEQHQLESIGKKGGAMPPKLRAIDWDSKTKVLIKGLERVRAANAKSDDPTKERRYFLAASPDVIPRVRTKAGREEDFDESTNFAGKQSIDLARLGFETLDVSGGRALVHIPAERFETLERTVAGLTEDSAQVRNRWVAIKDLDVSDGSWRLDQEWFRTLTAPVECIIEMQPVLSRVEADRVGAAAMHSVEHVVLGAGRDYSGRAWIRAKLNPASIRKIADRFVSIQRLHPPYGTALAAQNFVKPEFTGVVTYLLPMNILDLPTVALVDLGVDPVPALQPYRAGSWTSPIDVVPAGYATHPTKVASRIVFGNLKTSALSQPLSGDCRFFDVVVSQDPSVLHTQEPRLSDKAILNAMSGAMGVTPHPLTFVCPFDTKPVGQLSRTEREEKLALVRDLDNFIADNDVVVVVSAGNVAAGVNPSKPYPKHINDAAWQLGPWASAHNTLTCGGFVNDGESLHAPHAGLPSPFTRLGPGFAKSSAVPEASEHAGGETAGALVLTLDGTWKDALGTSYAAPLLAREAARSFDELQKHCPAGVRPSSALVKAFLALTADPGAGVGPKYRSLSKRSLGLGRMSSDRLAGSTKSALFLWQGEIEGTSDVARVSIPLPHSWWKAAHQPRLRLVVAWNSYVNDAARDLWSCRKVEAQLHGSRGDKALLKGSSARQGATYPRILRTYDLGTPEALRLIKDDELILQLSYTSFGMAPMPSTIQARLNQPAAFCAELFDLSGATSPFEDVIKLETVVGHMNQLRAAVTGVRVRIPQ